MKKRVISLLVAIVAVVAAIINIYLLFFKSSSQTVGQVKTENSSEAPVSSSERNTKNITTSAQSEKGYRDGVYTGAVIATNRGNYQVQLTVSNGKLTHITMLEWPQDNPQSKRISGNALPVYTAEALDKQSADVSLISGASEAYKGFTGSLQDALNQAKQ